MAGQFRVGWRQVACCFVLLACVSFIASSYSVIAVPLGRTFHSSRMVLMLAMTVMAAVSGLLSPFLGSLMDRTSMRRIMIVGAVMLAIGYASLSLTTSFTQVLIVFGLIIAPANVLIGPVAATVLIARWFTVKRGTAIGIAISGIAMGSVIFPPIIQGLLDTFEWRTAFQLFAVLLLAITLPAALLVVDRPSDRGLYPDGAPAPEVDAVQPALSRVPIRAILTDPAFWLGICIFTTTVAGTKGMVTNLAPMAIDQGIVARDAAWLISIYGITGFAAKLSFAVIADRIPSRILMLLSLGGFALGMLCLSRASAGFWMIAAGVSFVGLAGGLMVPMQSYLVPRIFGAHCVGRAMGLMSSVMLVALLTTPPLFGRIYDVTGSYAAIFLTFTGLAVCAMSAIPYLRLRPRDLPGRPPPAATTAI
jgi:predicted MFS family arabinose efflux permease